MSVSFDVIQKKSYNDTRGMYMNKICIGDNFQIQCYKHNGKVDRSGNEAVVLDIKKDYIVFGNDKVLLIDGDGRTRRTHEPAILYFFKNRWFNIMAQLKKDGITYYCNIATPFIIEEGTVKYIDYDLDLRIYNNGEYKILDKMEYKYHKKIMNYSEDLETAIKNGLDDLIKLYTNGSDFFNDDLNMKYYNEYLELKKQS